jgi:hypothetical protein
VVANTTLGTGTAMAMAMAMGMAMATATEAGSRLIDREVRLRRAF